MDEKYHEHAAAIEQAMRDDAMEQIRQQQAGQGQPYCDDCGELIPDARRKANPAAMRCITCQTTFEHLQKGHAR